MIYFIFTAHKTKIIKLFYHKLYIIITTDLAGGLFWPYKGLLPALESKDSSNGSPAATLFTRLALKGFFYLLCFTSSPVNGSIYSLSVIWSYSRSSFNWF